MPENVTGFQPTGNLKKPLRDLAYFDMLPQPFHPLFSAKSRKKIETGLLSLALFWK